MGKSKTPEERAAKKERKLAKLLKQSNTGEVAKDAEATSTQGSKGSELELAMEVDETVGEKPKKEKKSSKKRRLEEDAAQVDVSAIAIAEGSDAPKKKKRKEKKRDVEELPAESHSMNVDAMEAGATASAEESKPSEKKKVKEGKKEKREKRKKEGEFPPAPTEADVNSQASPSDAFSEQPSESLSKEDKKKVKRQKKAQANDEDTLSSPKKKKKKSKSKDEPSSAPTPSSPSKPRKNRTEFPDPFADESLSEQARKALDYAFVQFNDPSEWKFNKAKQNWLIRNVWSSEAIPDSYLPLATKYLTQVQGGSREKLKETCKAALSETVPPPPAVATEEADKPKSSQPIKGASEEPEKPKSILKPTKSVAGAIVAAAAPEPPKAPTANIKKERAQILLEALAEDTS